MLNQVFIMGRLTKDPELRHTQAQKAVANFTVAVDRDFQKDTTDFIECTAWGGTGEFVCRNFRKGSMIVVSGSLQSRKWEDREGNRRTSWEVSVQQVWFGEAKRNDGQVQLDGGEPVYDDGDLPF